MQDISELIGRSKRVSESWLERNEPLIDKTRRHLTKMNFPQIVHRQEFKCANVHVPLVAEALGYKKRNCHFTSDRKWRDCSGKSVALYEKVTDNV